MSFEATNNKIEVKNYRGESIFSTEKPMLKILSRHTGTITLPDRESSSERSIRFGSTYPLPMVKYATYYLAEINEFGRYVVGVGKIMNTSHQVWGDDWFSFNGGIKVNGVTSFALDGGNHEVTGSQIIRPGISGLGSTSAVLTISESYFNASPLILRGMSVFYDFYVCR